VEIISCVTYLVSGLIRGYLLCKDNYAVQVSFSDMTEW